MQFTKGNKNMRKIRVTIRKNEDYSCEILEKISVKVIDGVAQLDEQFYLDKYKTNLIFASRYFVILRDYKG